jgi:acyl-CoA synthetase (AMP-forming)/AMP-acid ligase II
MSEREAGDGLPLTIPALLHERVAQRGDHPLLICDEDVLSYANAASESARLAAGLLAWGAGRGTHVGLLHPNGPEFVVGWLAAARIGAIVVPLSTFSTSTELHALLRSADIEVLLATTTFRGRDYVDALRAAVPGLDLSKSPPLRAPSTPALRRIAFDASAADRAEGWTVPALVDSGTAIGDGVLAAAEDGVAPSDRMVIVHTSGSTSEPKGVIHQHGAFIRHLDNLNELRRYTDDEVLFSNSPFFWIGGFAYGLLGTLVAGATLVCSNAADAAETLDLLERVRPTMVNGFTTAVRHLATDPSFASRDLGSIRRGNLWPIMPAAIRPADPELRHNMLGMTEAGGVVLLDGDESDQPERRRGSFGRPAPGFETRIDEHGELCIRGPYVMQRYYKRSREECFDADGWFHTGDLVRRDADGFYYFVGRRGSMIKSAGATITPAEVEKAINRISGVATAYVFGVPDADRGQAVVAVIATDGHIDEQELRNVLRRQLSAYKIPKRIIAVAPSRIPLLSSGKVDTSRLAAVFDD